MGTQSGASSTPCQSVGILNQVVVTANTLIGKGENLSFQEMMYT